MNNFLFPLYAAAVLAVACASNEPAPPAGTPAATAARIEADIGALNDLAAVAIDAEALYREAAEIAEDPALKAELVRLAGERKSLADEFQREARAMGAEPATKGTALGFGHRIFADIRSAFDNDQQTAAGEVLRGENYLLDEMNEVLGNPRVSANVKSFVRGAISGVEADRDRVGALVQRYRETG